MRVQKLKDSSPKADDAIMIASSADTVRTEQEIWLTLIFH
jgi:hypothetical protein